MAYAAKVENVNFNNIPNYATVPITGVWTHADNVDGNDEYRFDGGKSLIALDIDWCSADLGGIRQDFARLA